MIKSFKDCIDQHCSNFDPERGHGHFEYIVEKKDEGFLISECEKTARDVRETAKLYESRRVECQTVIDCIESLRSILGVDTSPSIDSVVFISAAKQLVKERDKAVADLKLMRGSLPGIHFGKTESDSV